MLKRFDLGYAVAFAGLVLTVVGTAMLFAFRPEVGADNVARQAAVWADRGFVIAQLGLALVFYGLIGRIGYRLFRLWRR